MFHEPFMARRGDEASADPVVDQRQRAVLAGRLAGERPLPRGQAVVEEARPAAEEDRGDRQRQPVDLVGGQQRLDDARAGEDEDVAALGRP